MTLLELVQYACGEIGITQPSAVVSSTDDQVRQLYALSNRVGIDLMRDYEWRRLVKQYVFQTSAAVTTTGNLTSGSLIVSGIPSTASLAAGMVVSADDVPSFTEISSIDSATQVTLNMPATGSATAQTIIFATQSFALPTDHDRIVSDTQWDRSDHWSNVGPKSSQEWQFLNGGIVSPGPRFRWRLYGNKIMFFSAPQTVYNFAYEYVSNYWVIATGGTAPTKARFTLDTDTACYNDDVMVLGLKFQWYRAKGLDYAVPLAEFTRALSYSKAQDTPAPKMSLAPEVSPLLININSVPDGNWSL